MAREFASKFYNSARWKKARMAAMKEHFWLCQLCAKPAKIVHHIKHITPENIQDDDITLNLDNLMCLCQECHNRIHESAGAVRSGLMFDSSGQIVQAETRKNFSHTPLSKSAGSDFSIPRCEPPKNIQRIRKGGVVYAGEKD